MSFAFVRRLVPLIATGLALLAAAPAPAQYTWNGNSDGNWNNAANWSPASVPPSSNTTALTFSGTNNQLTTQNIASSFTLNALTFDATAGGFSVSGNALSFAGANPSLAQNSSSSILIASPVTFTASGGIGGSGSGSLSLSSLTVTTGTLAVNRNVTAAGLTLGAPGATAAAVVSTGSNLLTLQGDITFGGEVTGTPTTPPATINGRIDLGGASRTILGGSSNTTAVPQIDLFINAVISGSGGLVKGGSATQDRPNVLLGGQNTYTGPTVLQPDSNRLYLGVANALPATTAVTINANSALFLTDNENGANGFSQTVGSVSGPAGQLFIGPVAANTAVLTTGGDNSNTTFAGQILGGGRLVKVGTGTFTVTGNNGFSGGVTVSGGTLLVNNNSLAGLPGTGTGPVAVSAGAILGGNGTIVPATGSQATNTVTVTGTIAPGAAANTIGALTIGSSSAPAKVTINGTYLADLNAAAGQADQLAVTGTLALGTSSTLTVNSLSSTGGPFTATFTLAAFSSLDPTLNRFQTTNLPAGASLQYTPTAILLLVPVPEPAGVLAAGAAAAGLAGLVRRWRRRAARPAA
jgi:autotransporter-associated beta strand protein